MLLPALQCNIFDILAIITGVMLYVALPANLIAQLTAQELPAEDKPEM